MKYLISGIVQGLTEFLPVSSSAHLVFTRALLNLKEEGLNLFIWLHFMTLLSMVVFFRKDIVYFFKNRKFILFTLAVTFVTGCIGLIGKHLFEKTFQDPRLAAILLIIMGIILFSTKKFVSRGTKNMEEINFKDVLLMGIIQSLAFLPGISRSGITISFLLSRKIKPHHAFTFSFLVSIPLILATALYESRNIANGFNTNYLWSGIVTFLVGLASLKILSKFLNKGKFYLFGYYCLMAGLCVILFRI